MTWPSVVQRRTEAQVLAVDLKGNQEHQNNMVVKFKGI